MAKVVADRDVRSMPRLFYGWYVVLGGIGIQALQGALLNSSYGTYTAVLQNSFGWSKTALAGGYSLQQVTLGVIGPLEGFLIDRFGARAVMRIGIAVFGIGFVLFSRFNSLLTFYASLTVIAVGVSLGGFVPLSATIVNWFIRRRSTAMGLMSTGMGIGGFLAPVVAWSLIANGWRATAFASGLIVIAAGLPLTQLMRSNPEPYGYLPDGAPPQDGGAARADAGTMTAPGATVQDRSNDFTVGEAVHTSAFWLIAFGHGAALLVVSAVNVHLVSHLQQRLGYSLTRAAFFVAMITTFSMVGQIGGGYLGDRVSKRLLAVGCMLMHATALLLLAYATTVWMVVAFAVLHGLAWGVRGPQMQAIRADYFGRSAFGKIYGVSLPIVTLGTVGGPMVAGIMADTFGNYEAGFTVLAALSAAGAIFWLLLRKPVLPQRAAAPSR
jgi:sugar phosphate permease